MSITPGIMTVGKLCLISVHPTSVERTVSQLNGGYMAPQSDLISVTFVSIQLTAFHELDCITKFNNYYHSNSSD